MPPAQLIHNGNLYRVKQDPVEFLSTLKKPFTAPFGYVILHGAKDWVTEGTLVVGCDQSVLACFQCKKTVKCNAELRPDQINGLFSTIK